MIPDTIHHVRLEGVAGITPDRPDVLTACADSVKALHPGWKFVEHTDETVEALFDHPAVQALGVDFRALYDRTLYDLNPNFLNRHNPGSFRADLVKILILYVYGGFTLDYDVYALQPLDRFRSDEVVFGFLYPHLICEAVMGARAGDERFATILKKYADPENVNPVLRIPWLRLTERARELGIKPYPPEYFIPHDRVDAGELQYAHTKNTHTVHCWSNLRYDFGRLASIGVALRWGHTEKEAKEEGGK